MVKQVKRSEFQDEVVKYSNIKQLYFFGHGNSYMGLFLFGPQTKS
jgi:hypothetical protein